MGKPLFATACTTCRARIAVLREEAIGTILECPKCGGMVLIVPPEGWVSPTATPLSAIGQTASLPPSGPPPLTKVSQTYLMLDLESEVALTGWQKLLSFYLQSKIAWAGTAASICLIGVLIWALTGSSPTNVEVAQAVDSPKKVEKQVPAPKADTPEKLVAKAELPPAHAVATAAPANPPAVAKITPPEPKPPEPKPPEPKIAEAKPVEPKPAEDLVEPKPLEVKPLEAKSEETIVVNADPVEPAPLEPAPAEAESDAPPAANAIAANVVLPSVPDLPPAVKIQPLPVEKPVLLPAGAARLIKQVPPPEVDVNARMDDVVPSLELQDVPLVEAVSIVSSLSTVPITLDADAMKRQGVAPRDLITVNVKDTTVERLLEEIASRRGLAVDIEKGQVVITAPAEQTEKFKTVPYTVSDLCDNAVATVELATLLEKFVQPDTWSANGGQGTIKFENRSFKIFQTGAVHREIVIFCEKLRLARGLSLRSKLDPSRLQLVSAYTQVKPLLEKPLTVNFHQATTLAQIVDTLSNRTGAVMLLDRRAMAAAGMSDKMQVSFTAEKKPLEKALEALLLPLNLGYRAIDARTLQIVPQKELDRRAEWEIYPIEQLLPPGQSSHDLILKLKQSIAPTSWTNRGQIHYDSLSKSLLISQSPAVQAAISRYLAEKPPK